MEMHSPPPGGPPAPEKMRLKVVEGNAAGMVIEVEEEFVIGRQAEGDGTLASDVEISRQHARVAPDNDGRFAIEDLGSTNGTFINGRRLEGRTTLETGDRIEVGASALVVQVGNLQPTPTASGTIAPPPRDVEPEPGSEPGPPAEAPPPETELAVPGTPESAPASLALRIEVDFQAGTAAVSLDEGSDEVKLVNEDGRWRLG